MLPHLTTTFRHSRDREQPVGSCAGGYGPFTFLFRPCVSNKQTHPKRLGGPSGGTQGPKGLRGLSQSKDGDPMYSFLFPLAETGDRKRETLSNRTSSYRRDSSAHGSSGGQEKQWGPVPPTLAPSKQSQAERCYIGSLSVSLPGALRETEEWLES